MRSFVQSVKSFFRGKKTDDKEEEDEQQAAEKEKKKFIMSCKRKKKEKQTPNRKKSAESAQKTAPPVKRQSTSAPVRAQPSIQTPKSISKSPDTVKAPDKTRNVSVRLERKKSSEKIASQYAEFPMSMTARPVQSRTFDISSRGSNEGTSSARKIKEFSARALRKVKTFVSRPVKQSTLKKVADRVERRKKLEQNQTSHPLTHGEDMFPKQKASASKRKMSIRSDVFLPLQSEAVEKNIVKVGTLPSGTVLVKNNDNDGQLFVEGRRGAMCPFWTATRRPTDEDMLNSDTEDDLQLNADVVLEVMNGKINLVEMPTVPVVLDPINEIKLLQERDKLFFNREILFGNTVRTMINLSDQNSMRTVPRRKRKEAEELNVTEPKEYVTYKVGEWTQFRREAFCSSKKSN